MLNERIFYKNPNRPARILIGKKWHKGIIADTHIHPELELLYVTSGEIKVTSDTDCIIAKKNDIVFVNRKAPHATEFMEDGTSQSLIQFKIPSGLKESLKYLSSFLNHTSLSLYIFKKTDPDYDEILSYVLDMLDKNQKKDITNDYYVTSNIYRILAVLYKKQILISEENNINFTIIHKLLPVFEYIDSNFKEQITLENLANLLSLNKDYFCRLFKKATGTTAIDYLNYVRVCKAEDLLKADLSITDVAYAVGFSSASYFNSTFKKYKNYSPTIYKKIYNQLSVEF